MPVRQTTGRGLSPTEAFVGLVDHGLFNDQLPPCFHSTGLSSHISPSLQTIATETVPAKLWKAFRGATHDYIRHYVLRHENLPRQFGVPHPESYLAQCLAIHRTWATIKRHCAKPAFPVSRIFARKIQGSNSIFQMNYKGTERSTNIEVDLQSMTGAAYAAHTDISDCFPSMYTHSIPWALHGLTVAKKNRTGLLDGNILDRATQCIHDGQTNGLLIGPHASNVIAEIILAAVDYNILSKGFDNCSRYIDDYTFYSKTRRDAERFLRELDSGLRKSELSLNPRKTGVLSMPRPLEDNWISELNLFRLTAMRGSEIGIGPPAAFLDLALRLAQNDTYRVLNYAIKMVPDRLNTHARRLFARHVVNLALRYPYLSPILEEHVFEKHRYDGVEELIQEFANELLVTATRRVFPDAVCQALYFSLKYKVVLSDLDDALGLEVIDMEDCLATTLLLRYAGTHGLALTSQRIRGRVRTLRQFSRQEQDRAWLLMYQVCQPKTLKDAGQAFLADLKTSGFQFLRV